jgi:hypothetical protein
MSTNERELITAKDLPVTEAEEVNVLVVDPTTGELAQKAGINLGGSGVIELEVEFVPYDYATDDGEYYRFANMDQMQKVIDNNMNLHIVIMSEDCGTPVVTNHAYSCLKDTLIIGDNSGTPYAYRYADYNGDVGVQRIDFSIDEAEYTSNESIKITDSRMYLHSTLVKVYASFV